MLELVSMMTSGLFIAIFDCFKFNIAVIVEGAVTSLVQDRHLPLDLKHLQSAHDSLS